jgi:methionyl-tRNA formyltransferase
MLRLRRFDKAVLDQYFNLEDSVPLDDNLKEFNYDLFFNHEFTSRYDLMLIASYGGKIPEKIFASPRLGTWNIHPSVLPELRGGYPTLIQSLDHSYLVGTTIHQMTDKIDKGKIILQSIGNITDNTSNIDLMKKSALDAARLLTSWVDNKYVIEPHKTINVNPSACLNVYRPEWNLRKNRRDLNLQKLVNAFCSPHLFPFIYLFYSRSFIQFIKVGPKKLNDDLSQDIRVTFLTDPEKANIQYYDGIYEMHVYFVNGKLYQRELC